MPPRNTAEPRRKSATSVSDSPAGRRASEQLAPGGDFRAASSSTGPPGVKVGPEDSDHGRRLVQAGVIFPRYTKHQLKNYTEIRDKLDENTHFIDVNEAELDFKKFQNSFWKATTENDVLLTLKAQLKGEDYYSAGNHVQFSNIRPISTSIKAATPDHYDGEEYSHEDTVALEALSEFIRPTEKGEHSHTCPNFFMEIKGPIGHLTVLKRQAFHNGAVGAQAMHHLRHHIGHRQEKLYDDKAYCLSVTFDASGTLMIFACHVSRARQFGSSEDLATDELNYHITFLCCYSLIQNLESYKVGMTALHNARKWAKAQRSHALSEARSCSSKQSSCKKASQEDEDTYMRDRTASLEPVPSTHVLRKIKKKVIIDLTEEVVKSYVVEAERPVRKIIQGVGRLAI